MPFETNDRPSLLEPQERSTSTISQHMEYVASLLRENGPTLAERYSWLEAMINHVPDYIYAKDLNGRFLFANNAVVLNNGLSNVDELIGLTDFDLHGAELAAPIAEIEQRVIRSGIADLGFEERALKGGPDRWLMMSRVPLMDSEGNIVGVVGASRDITARKMSERLMSVQARLLEMIVAAVPAKEFFESFTILLQQAADGIETALFLPHGKTNLTLAACSPPGSLNETTVWVDDMAMAASELEEVVRRKRDSQDHVRSVEIRASDGSLHALLVMSLCGRSPEPSFCEFVASAARLAGIAVDRLLAEKRIRFLAEHDALTGLLKRDGLDLRLKGILASSGRRRHAGGGRLSGPGQLQTHQRHAWSRCGR
ncbi:MAG: PAS domain-containing protein [Rhizobium sp.]|nr:PAS domain-containing protein [Rhizobium sp.]